MKQAMVGTFFDRWLAASGWMDGIHGKKRAGSPPVSGKTPTKKRQKSDDVSSSVEASLPKDGITSQAELEKLIRAVATNPGLDPVQKNTTIQGLRTSVWKQNQRLMGKAPAPTSISTNDPPTPSRPSQSQRPSAYYQQNQEGETTLVWKESSNNNQVDNEFVPKFSPSELAPTYHDHSNNGEVLGCAHYARACKLRHPLSGRLYTCRLCCEHEREAPSGDKDEPLDRYAVTEVSCMKCKSLQPAAKECANQDCELNKKGFAKYYCDICHLYDDRPRPIFHCPYCNTCRSGQGLGIDYRHCMRCNACVSLADKDHRCIPQKLQGACPICHDTLFNSTEPLRGLRCGHVMHLSCFTEYRRGQRYTCPLCMRCMEDMSEYFALMDQAVRMQIMPPMYQNMFCNIYCQDCDKTGQCRYHFVGQKCPHCGSYNTREMGRFEGVVPSSSS
jgi:Zinc-ribbon/CHY zinc finger/Ring finger domain